MYARYAQYCRISLCVYDVVQDSTHSTLTAPLLVLYVRAHAMCVLRTCYYIHAILLKFPLHEILCVYNAR